MFIHFHDSLFFRNPEESFGPIVLARYVTYNPWKLTRKWVGGSFRQIERKVACGNSLEFRKTKSKQNQSRTARSEAERLPTEHRAQLFATVLKREERPHWAPPVGGGVLSTFFNKTYNIAE